MLDLLLKNAAVPDGRAGMAIAVSAGKIVEVSAGLDAPAHVVIDAQGEDYEPLRAGAKIVDADIDLGAVA